MSWYPCCKSSYAGSRNRISLLLSPVPLWVSSQSFQLVLPVQLLLFEGLVLEGSSAARLLVPGHVVLHLADPLFPPTWLLVPGHLVLDLVGPPSNP